MTIPKMDYPNMIGDWLEQFAKNFSITAKVADYPDHTVPNAGYVSVVKKPIFNLGCAFDLDTGKVLFSGASHEEYPYICHMETIQDVFDWLITAKEAEQTGNYAAMRKFFDEFDHTEPEDPKWYGFGEA